MFVVVNSEREEVYGPFRTRAHAIWWIDQDYRIRMGYMPVPVDSILGVSEVPDEVTFCPLEGCIRSGGHDGSHEFMFSSYR